MGARARLFVLILIQVGGVFGRVTIAGRRGFRPGDLHGAGALLLRQIEVGLVPLEPLAAVGVLDVTVGHLGSGCWPDGTLRGGWRKTKIGGVASVELSVCDGQLPGLLIVRP